MSRDTPRDAPWLMRTYSGHSTAASNELYRSNLAKGRTRISIAFDLPTQTVTTLARPRRRGRSARSRCAAIVHRGHMEEELMAGIPVGR